LLRALGRYLRLCRLLFKLGLLRQMAYRFHFFLMITGKVIRMGLLLLFFQAVFLKVERLGAWTFDHVLLLFATFHIVDYVMSITFQRNLAFRLPERIRTGELDTRMVLPVSLLFLASLEELDLMDFFSSIPAVAFLIYVLDRIDFAFTWTQALAYCVLLVNAVVFLFSMVLIISSISFWTVRSYGLARIFDNLLKVGRYPLDIFEGFWKICFVYVLPLVMIAQVPSQALLATLSPGFAAFGFAVTFGLLVLALFLWKRGLANYLSASS
jgi:viologen exporter family transport system permease protein